MAAVSAPEPPRECANCASTGDDVAPRSPDLDIRPVQMCDLCSVALVCDRELFDDLGRKRVRRG